MTNNLNEFAELIRKGKQEQRAKTLPLITDFVSEVARAKEKQEAASPVKKSDVADIISTIKTEVDTIVQEKLESQKQDENPAEKYLQVIKVMQGEIKLLRDYVHETRTAIRGMTPGGGEVRILRMDDVLRLEPTDGQVLAWSTALNKFVPTNIQSDDTMPLSKRIDFVSENLIYKGESNPGTVDSASGWRIHRLVIAPDGDVTETWAEGNANMDKVWDNRATYTFI
jgi:hypothetical protein